MWSIQNSLFWGCPLPLSSQATAGPLPFQGIVSAEDVVPCFHYWWGCSNVALLSNVTVLSDRPWTRQGWAPYESVPILFLFPGTATQWPSWVRYKAALLISAGCVFMWGSQALFAFLLPPFPLFYFSVFSTRNVALQTRTTARPPFWKTWYLLHGENPASLYPPVQLVQAVACSRGKARFLRRLLLRPVGVLELILPFTSPPCFFVFFFNCAVIFLLHWATKL